ncbi:MAG: repeat protein [Pedosphaera sp.]|nr:repeat protein [Pedosphaera sp.]
MATKRKILLPVLGIVAVGVLAWLLFREPPEPVYQGKPLSVWLKSFDMGNSKEDADVAADAVRHIGTKALPKLLGMISSKDRNSRWESVLSWINGRQSVVHAPVQIGLIRRMRAVSAFHALGASAKPAVPGLAQVLFKDPGNEEASAAMVVIGPEAMPAVMQGVTNSDPKIREVAVKTLGGMSFDANTVVPVLIKSLKDGSGEVRFSAALSLGNFAQKAAVSVPALAESLSDKDDKVRRVALYSLGRLGSEAHMALPAIKRALDDPSKGVRSAATNALKKVDPEAAAEPGIR